MELQTVEIPRAKAREQAAEYLREAKRISDPGARREFEEIARAYRIAAADEVPLIALTPTIAGGGTVTRTLVSYRGTEHEQRAHYLLPKLAVCRADAPYVYTLGIERDGYVRFVDRLYPHHRLVHGRLTLDVGFELPRGYEAGHEIGNWTGRAWGALVPIVPPKHRPGRAGGMLRSYHLLWEVDDWAWTTAPAPPGDPALLKHVGGDIYAVLATWDLTDLERLVLTGRRPS